MLLFSRGQYALTSFEPSWPKQDFVRRPHPRTSTGVHIWCFLVIWYGNVYAFLCPCHVVLTLSLSLLHSVSLVFMFRNDTDHIPSSSKPWLREKESPLPLSTSRGTCMLPSPQLLWTNDWWFSFYGGLQLDYTFTRKISLVQLIQFYFLSVSNSIPSLPNQIPSAISFSWGLVLVTLE